MSKKTFLLDVNVLLALIHQNHEFHLRARSWLLKQSKGTQFATTPITELGFIRISSQVEQFSFTTNDARKVLETLSKSNKNFGFLADDCAAKELPDWARGPKQLTDAHLLTLASKHKAQLVTFDKKIPGAEVVP